MYRCEICQTVTQPRQPRLVHAITRTIPRISCRPDAPPTRAEIARELAVCSDCQFQLTLGLSLAVVIRRRGRPRKIPAPQLAGWCPPPPPPLLKASPTAPTLLPGKVVATLKVVVVPPVEPSRPLKPLPLPGRKIGGIPKAQGLGIDTTTPSEKPNRRRKYKK